jgi:hypothetical protein
MAYDLRALSLGELLDRSFGLYRRHFLLFVGIMAVPSAVMLVLSVGLQLLQAPSLQPDPLGSQMEPEMIIGAVAGGVALFLAIGVLYWITYAVALGATTVAVAEIYGGAVPSVASSYRAVRGRTGRLSWLLFQIFIRLFLVLLGGVAMTTVAGAGAAVLVGPAGMVIALAGMVGAMLACLWMVLRYGVAVASAVLEDAPAGAAIRRSIDLTRGHLWRVLVLVVFAVIVSYAALGIFQFPFLIAAFMAGPETGTGFWLNMAGVIAGSVAAAFTSPLAVVAGAVLYYDLRIRKEGLDLELMIAGLTASGAPAAPSAPSSAPLTS